MRRLRLKQGNKLNQLSLFCSAVVCYTVLYCDLLRIQSDVIGHGRGTAVSLFGVWNANYYGNLCITTSVDYPFLYTSILISSIHPDKLIKENLIDRFHHSAPIVKGGFRIWRAGHLFILDKITDMGALIITQSFSLFVLYAVLFHSTPSKRYEGFQ